MYIYIYLSLSLPLSLSLYLSVYLSSPTTPCKAVRNLKSAQAPSTAQGFRKKTDSGSKCLCYVQPRCWYLTHINTCVYLYKAVCMYMYIYIYVYVHMRTKNIHVKTDAYTCVCMNVLVYLHMWTYMYTQIICISVLYVHMYMHAAPLHVFLWEASGCLQATTARIPGLRYPF